jgi:glycosyltransferase involved in cell wall biosynthesis
MDLQKERFTVIEHAVPGEAVSVQPSFDVDERCKVGFVGAISEKVKGRDVVLRLLDGNEDGQFEWHFFGQRSDIRESIHDKSVTSKGLAQFHGYYEEGELATVLQKTKINVVVIPSIYAESYSYVLTEVWKAGIPVIGADMGAIGERVRKFGGGWLYRPGSGPESIPRILARIREDSKLYQAKAKEAMAVKHRDFNEFVDQYTKMYLELVGGSEEKHQMSDFLRYFRLSKPRLG